MGVKIVIVEDESIVAMELEQRLIDSGYQIVGVTDNGETAIRLTSEMKPDLVLMDINIKGEIDGIETASRIRKKMDVPIIYLTAFSDKATLEKAKLTSPYGFLLKPIEERDLHISIEISLAKFKMEKQLKENEKSLSITLQSIGDAVIATDKNGLITRMNTAAERLCGWTFKEAQGIESTLVFDIINAITRETCIDPVQKVLNTKETVELENHTILISKIGVERHISDSASPIKDDSGEIQGVVLVFSDVTENYLNRERLKQSEKLYREVVENASDLIYTTNHLGKIIHANDAAFKFTGYSREEVYSSNFSDLVHPDYRSKAKMHYYRQFIDKKTSTYLELPVVKKGGDTCWFGQNVSLILDGDNVLGFHVISRDITGRKEAEDALKKSEIMLRQIIDIIPDRVFVKDLDGKFILNNISHLNALGAKNQAATIGKTDFDFRPPDASSLYQQQDQKVIDTKKALSDFLQHEFNYNNEETWLLVSKLPFINEEGEIIGTVGISRDITKQKYAEDAIRESERRFQTLANVSPVGIFRTDSTGYTTYVNPRWCEISGLSFEEALGDGWLSAVLDEDKIKLSNEWHSAAKDKRSSKVDYRFLRKDGTISWVMGHAVPEYDSNNEIIGYVGTITDITQRKIAEDGLRESENIFSQLLEHSPVLVFFKDQEGRIIRVSKNFEQLLGLPLDKITGKTMFDLFPSDFTKLAVESDIKVLKEGKPHQIEENFRGRHFATIVFPIMFEGKSPILAGFSMDITERKINELEIQKLANALKSINECVSITDLNNNLIFVNQSFLNTYGYHEHELIGKNISLVGSEKNAEGLLEEVHNSTLAGGWNGELINRKKDGTEFPIQLSTTVIYDKHNNPISMIGVASNITERKKIEFEIIKLNQAVIQSPASIIITDTNGNIEYVNPKASHTSGYAREELIGKNPRIFSSGIMSNEIYKSLWETITSGNEWRGEFQNRKRNGELYWEFTSISPIKDKTGIITNYIAIKEDITERKKLEDGLVKAKEKAEAANELKDAFIANISHEIRTPLNGLLGMTAIIEEVFAKYTTPVERKYFDAISKSSRRIIRTVDMIINFSRLQVGDFQYKLSSITVDDFINDLLLDYKKLSDQKGLELVFENKIGQLKLKSDQYCLTQVLGNLIDNAIKYTDSGSVKVVLSKNHQNNVNIDIEDTGIGISEEYSMHLFEPYTQEEIGYTRPYEGVGLGLSLVKKFAYLINLELALQSKKGIGTTVSVTFKDVEIILEIPYPVAPAVAKNDSPVKFKTSSNKKPVILVIEDETINQYFLSVKLKENYEIEIVDNAGDAFSSLKSKEFDLILMDISLQGNLNGIELTTILKGKAEYSSIPIIAVTGHAFGEDKEKCLEAGCNDYVSKPFNFDELEHKINKLLLND